MMGMLFLLVTLAVLRGLLELPLDLATLAVVLLALIVLGTEVWCIYRGLL